MSLLGMESWDIYATADITDYFTSVGPGAIVAGQGRCGTSAFLGTATNGSGPDAGVVTSEISGYASFAYSPTGFNAVDTFVLGSTGSGAASNWAFINAEANGSISLWKGVNQIIGTQVGQTQAGLLAIGHYSAIGVEFKQGGSGYLRVYVDGLLVADTGIIDMTAPFTDGKPWGRVTWHPIGYIDDLYWGDTAGASPWNAYFGDCHVEGQVVNAPGNYLEWTPSAGIDHVALVDEIPPDQGATYVFSSTPGQREIFGFPAIVPASGSVFGIQLMPNMVKTNFESRTANGLVRVGGSDAALAAYAVATVNWKYYAQVMQVNPVSSAAWTVSTANSMQGGVEVAS